MMWGWAKDERGEELLTAQEIYACMVQSKSNIGWTFQRDVLIEAIEGFLSTAISSGRISPS